MIIAWEPFFDRMAPMEAGQGAQSPASRPPGERHMSFEVIAAVAECCPPSFSLAAIPLVAGDMLVGGQFS
jgi:hypothetical protein